MKKGKQPARRQASTAKISEAARLPQKTSDRSRWIRYGVYGLVVLAAIGARFWFAGPDVPRPSLDGVDPALVEDIENARAVVWKSPGRPESWGRLGMLLAAHSFMDEARQCFDKAQEFDTENWKWPYLKAITWEANDARAALDALRETAVVAGEDEPMPKLLLIERLLENGELEEAERHLQTARRFWPEHPRVKLDGARLRWARQDARGAIVLLQGKVLEDPHTRRTAHQLAAQLNRALGHEEHAADLASKLDGLPPDEAWPDPYREELQSYHTSKGAYIARIHELDKRGDANKLKRAMAEAIDRYPELGNLVAGRQRLAAGDAAGAETALREALRYDPRSVDALVSLGEAQCAQKKYEDAEEAFRRALQHEPTNGQTHLRLGRLLIKRDEGQRAIDSMRLAVQYMPASAEAHKALAEALAAAGQAEEAEEHLQHAERLNASPRGQRPRENDGPIGQGR